MIEIKYLWVFALPPIVFVILKKLMVLDDGIPKKESDLPGPKAWRFVGNALQFDFSILAKDFMNLEKTYGKYFRVFLGPKRAVVVSDPESVTRIQKHHNDIYDRVSLRIALQDWSISLFSLDGGEFWKALRTLTSTSFDDKQIKGSLSEILRGADDLCKRFDGYINGTSKPSSHYMDSKGYICLDVHFKELTLDNLGRTLLGWEFGENKESNTFLNVLQYFIDFDQYDKREKWYWKWTSSGREYYKNKKILHSEANEILRQAKESNKTFSKSILNGMLNGTLKMEDGERAMTPLELMNEFVGFVVAGHDTLKLTLTWLFSDIFTHPDVAKKVREELISVLGDRVFIWDDLQKLPYTLAVINESMRLRPILPLLMRDVIVDDKLGGFDIKKGDMIFANIYAMNRDKGIWGDDADIFNPERFYQKPAKKSNVFQPFGAGPRLCIGQRFALMQILSTTSVFIRKYTFEIDRTRMKEKIIRSIVPVDGLWAKISAV